MNRRTILWAGALCLLFNPGIAQAQTLLFHDDFTNSPPSGSRSATFPTSTGGANSTTGLLNSWHDIQGSVWSMPASGQAQGVGGGDNTTMAYAEAVTALRDEENTAKFTEPSNTFVYPGVVARGQTDRTNLYIARYEASNTRLNLAYCDHGTTTSLGTATYTATAGTSYVVRIHAAGASPTTIWATLETPTGTVLAHIGRTTLGDTAITTSSGPQGTGYPGMATTGGAAGATYTDFAAYDASATALTPGTLTLGSVTYNSVALSWGAATGGSGTGYTYDVKRATNAGFTTGVTTLVSAQAGTSYSDTTVSASSSYYYEVVAHDSAAASATSNIVGPANTPAAPVLATGFSVSPTSGTGAVGAASSNFTVTLNGYLSSSATVSLSDGGNGGTFTPASLTFAPNGTAVPAAQTFTYTPASAGTQTLTPTSPGLTASPTTVAYTANAAPVSFALSSPGIVHAGGFTEAVLQGRLVRQPIFGGRAYRLDFGVTGTDASLAYYAVDTSDSITLTVDGVTTTPTLTTGSWQTLALFAGKAANSVHSVEVKFALGGSFQNLYLDSSGLTVSNTGGGAPTLSYAPGYSPLLSVSSGAVALEGGWTPSSRTVTPVAYGSNANGAALRFRATANTIKLFLPLSGETFRVAVDGVDRGVAVPPASSTAPVTVSSAGGYDWVTVFSDQALTGQHEYTLSCLGTTANYVLSEMMLQSTTDGATFTPGTLAGGPIAPREYIAVLGHSFTSGSVATDFSLAYPQRLARDQNVGLLDLGIAGTFTTGQAAGSADLGLLNRLAPLTSLAKKPYCIIVDCLVNDVQSYSGLTSTLFQASATSVYRQLAAMFPATQVLILGATDTNGSLSSSIAPFNTAAQAAVAATGASNLHYVDMGGLKPGSGNAWAFVSGDWNADGPGHPTNSGHYKYAKYLESTGLLPTPPLATIVNSFQPRRGR